MSISFGLSKATVLFALLVVVGLQSRGIYPLFPIDLVQVTPPALPARSPWFSTGTSCNQMTFHTVAMLAYRTRLVVGSTAVLSLVVPYIAILFSRIGIPRMVCHTICVFVSFLIPKRFMLINYSLLQVRLALIAYSGALMMTLAMRDESRPISTTDASILLRRSTDLMLIAFVIRVVRLRNTEAEDQVRALALVSFNVCILLAVLQMAQVTILVQNKVQIGLRLMGDYLTPNGVQQLAESLKVRKTSRA